MADNDSSPDLGLLVACGAQVAKAMGQREADVSGARLFFRALLHADRQQGGKEIWAALTAGLITETEARDAVMARFATWLSRENGVDEPSSETWSTPELERSFEIALLGRPASQAR